MFSLKTFTLVRTTRFPEAQTRVLATLKSLKLEKDVKIDALARVLGDLKIAPNN